MDTDSFVISIFTEDLSEDTDNDVERWFDRSNYNENYERPLQIGVNKKVIGMFKDKLGAKNYERICALRAKTCTYLMDDDSENKGAKGIKRCIVKKKTNV